MATSNFHNENASQIYSILNCDDFTFEDTKSNLQYALEKQFGVDYSNNKEGTSTGLRSFPAVIIGTVSVDKYYEKLDLDLELEIDIIIRDGYYDGMNLDFEFNLFENRCSVEIDSELDFIDYAETDKQAKQYEGYARKWIEKASIKYAESIEETFSKHSTKLDVVARFSNGETIYTKAS